MAEKKKPGRPKKNQKVEYENVTQGTIAWVEVFDTTTGTGNKVIKGVAVHPQSSQKNPKCIYFTPEEVELNKVNSPNIFLNGILRPVDAEIRNLRDLKPRDDMAIIEIAKYIEITEDITKFTKELDALRSVNTLNLFEKYVIELNRTIDFFQAVQAKKLAVTEEKAI